MFASKFFSKAENEATVCPKSPDPLYIVPYHIKWEKPSLVYSNFSICINLLPISIQEIVCGTGDWKYRGIHIVS